MRGPSLSLFARIDGDTLTRFVSVMDYLTNASNHKTGEDGRIDNASVYSSGHGDLSGSDLGHASSSRSSVSASADYSTNEGTKTWRTVDDIPKVIGNKELAKTFPSLCASSGSSGPIIGLKLGKHMYFEDFCGPNTAKISSSNVPTTKRSRTSTQSTQTSCCQVEGCNIDLKSSKDYHRRHRICENHSKSPKVIVAGMERRFCQQCSRFHELSEFDDKKRSCRRRLSDHNARRRRPQPEGVQFSSATLSSTYYDGRQQMNVIFNAVPFPAVNPTCHNACCFKITQTRDSSLRPVKGGDIDRLLNLPTNEVPDATCTLEMDSNRMLSFESGTSELLSQGVEVSAFGSSLDVAQDLGCALSLLSTTSWGLNEMEPSSMDELIRMNQSSMAQPMMHVELSNCSVASSEHERAEQQTPESQVHSVNLAYNGSNNHFQEFQLLKAPSPYELGCFYSSYIN